MATRAEIKARGERHRQIIADQILRGVRPAEIARQLRLTPEGVQTHLRTIREEWHALRAEAFDAHVARHLAKIRALEREAWEALEKSKRDRERVETVTGGEKDGYEKTVIEGRDGSDQWFDKLLQCWDREARLLGLLSPEKFALTDPTGRKAATITVAHLQQATNEELELLTAAGEAQARLLGLAIDVDSKPVDGEAA